MGEFGLGNPITVVLLAYRALDTLLEKVVLVLALIGVWTLTPDEFWGGAPASLRAQQSSGALTFLAQVLPPVGVVIGVYLIWNGADHPGGTFQGGTVLAAMWLLVMMADLREPPEIRLRTLRLLVVLGPVVFLVAGFAGFWIANGFLSYPPAFAKPIIVIVEAALALSIAVILGMLVAGPAARPRDDEHRHSVWSLRRGFGGDRALRPRASPHTAAQGHCIQPPGKRHLPSVRHRCTARGGRRILADPVPQAMVITGIVVAFASTALAVALLLRLQETGASSIEPTSPEQQDDGAS